MNATSIILLVIVLIGAIIFLCGVALILIATLDLLIDLFLRLFDAIFG